MADGASYGSSLGIQASAGTSQGPYPNAGTNFIQNVLKPQHNRAHRAPISDMPSLGVRPLTGVDDAADTLLPQTARLVG